MKEKNEFENFDRTMRELMKVPHSEIQAELEAEKAAKKNRPKQKRKTNDHRNQNDNSGQ